MSKAHNLTKQSFAEESLDIKFVQGSGEEIIDLDVDDRPMVYVTSDT